MILGLALLLLGFSILPGTALAAGSTRDQAHAQCTGYISDNNLAADGYTCVDVGEVPAGSGFGYWNLLKPDGSVLTHFLYTWTAPSSNPCNNIPSVHIDVPGKILEGYTFTQNAQDPSSGAWVACVMNFSPSGVPTQDQNGKWTTYGSASSSGNPAGAGNGDTPGTWVDGNGNPPVPAPPPVPQPPVDNPAPPQTCGGGSCYDPNTDQYCGVGASGQFCLPGSAARSNAGGCVSSGDATLCGGASAPPIPPSSNVSDPSTQITNSDKTTQANPTTGAPVTVTINTYNVTPGASSSGQKAGDSGPSAPASSSSSGKASGSYGGGGDCNTPPVCSGDPVLCGASRSQWATTCQLHTDLAGDGTGVTKLAADSTKYSLADVTVQPGQGNTVGDAANNGSYDQSGFGFDNQCPMTDLTVPVLSNSFDIPFSKGCIIGPWVRGVLLAFALFAAARITAGSNR